MGILDRIAGRLEELGVDRRVAMTADVLRARERMAAGDLAEAERLLEDLTARFPEAPEAFLTLGELRVAQGAREAAVVPLGRAVDLDGGRADAWCMLGETLATLGRTEPARDALHRALSLAIDPALRRRAHAALGDVYAASGRLAQAQRELAKAVDLAAPGSDDRRLAVAYGRVLARLGEPEASEWLTRAARAENADPALFAEAARSTRDPARAETLLREGMTRAPDDVAVRIELARLLVAAGRADEALPLVDETVARAPADPRAWRARRETLVARQQWTEALAAAEKERALGAPPPFEARVTLALGAEDPARLGELAERVDGAGLCPAESSREVQGTLPGFLSDRVDGAGLCPAESSREVQGTLPGFLPDYSSDAETAAALRAFVAGTAGEGDRIRLGRLAPGESARRFVARPPLAAPPAGDLAGLLGWTHALATVTPGLVGLAPAAARALEAFDRPLLVAVMGEFNAGKSSFVNALCGADVAPTGVTPTTATINVLRYGERAETRVVHHDGSTEPVRAADAPTFLSGLSAEDARAIRSVDIFLPVEALRRVEIVDTPGLNAIRPEHERVAREFLRDADAIVWVFATGQAAKATEREALAVAHDAGKRVIGVVNKIDLAGPGELKAVIRHVEKTLGDLVDSVVPFSATAAAEARRAGRADPGLAALTATLDRRFLSDARALKRQTALGALHRLVEAARNAAPAPARPDAEHRRAAEARLRRELSSALDAERIGLGARIEAGYRRAAIEVRDFVQPRTWLFGDNRATPADEDFLAELLEDAVTSALEATRAALQGAVADAAADPETAALAAQATGTVNAALELFAAYARGTIRAGVVPDFFRHQLPRLRLELPAIREALARRAPSPEAPLFAGLRRELDLLFLRAATEREARAADEAMRAIIHEESVERPLAALAGAITALESA